MNEEIRTVIEPDGFAIGRRIGLLLARALLSNHCPSLVIAITVALTVGCRSRVVPMDSSLWQSDPELAERQLLSITSPRLRVVRSDRVHGTLTLRYDAGNLESTITFDQARAGYTGLGTPAWVPRYPGTERSDDYFKDDLFFDFRAEKGGYGEENVVQDSPRKVISFYRDKCEAMGMEN